MNSITSITGFANIIPNMIFGIVLIIGWLPVIIMTEKNNKGNSDEYKLLLEKLKTATFTDVTNTFTFPSVINLNNTDLPQDIKNIQITGDTNNNLFITYVKSTTTTDAKGNKTTSTDTMIKKNVGNVLIGTSSIDSKNYEYLAMQNNIYSDRIKDTTDENISYNVNIYSIPKNKTFFQVGGLKEFEEELDMTIYDYEFGPKEDAINAIKKRKDNADKLQMWLGRIGTFLMLFIGLSLLVSPLRAIVQLGEALPGPLKLLVLPGQIILSIYEALSLFGSLILTILITFLVWTIINQPLLSILVGSMLVGFILYFQKK